MLRRHIVLLIAIRPSDGDVKPGGPLCAFREEQAMSRHRVSPSPFIIPHNTVTHTVTLSSTSYSILYRYRPIRNVVCPSGAWFENRPHSTPSIHLAWNPKHVIVQWVGIGTHTFENLVWKLKEKNYILDQGLNEGIQLYRAFTLPLSYPVQT